MSKIITGVQDFLIECQPKLQKVFNNCGFHNTEGSLALLNEQTVRQLALLEENSKRLIGKESSHFLTSTEVAGIVTTTLFRQPIFFTNVELTLNMSIQAPMELVNFQEVMKY